MNEHLDTVAIVAQSHLRHLHIALAAELHRRHRSRITLYCGTQQDADWYRRQQGSECLEHVVVAPDGVPDEWASGLDEAEVVHRARAIEMRLGITMNRLAMANRHLGRGYALTGPGHPRSRQSRMDYLSMLHTLSEALEFWENEFAGRAYGVILDANLLQAVCARAAGIPVRVFVSSRFRSYHFWAVDEKRTNPAIRAAFDETTGSGQHTLDVPETGHMALRSSLHHEFRPHRVAARMLMHVTRRTYWQLRGYRKGRTYRLGDELAMMYRQARDVRQMTRPGLARLDDLRGKPYVFFPLHTEPEVALQVLSPEYFFQHACIAGLSRDLPAGARLVVKDTEFALGRRPTNFYQQLCDLKNVRMADVRELGLELARHANIVCTISGTAGFEAAALGVPVLAYGRHNTYNFLRHVRVVTTEDDLRAHLTWAMEEVDREQARRDGMRFLEAIVRIGVDMGGFTEVTPDAFTDRMVMDMYADLRRSFEDARATAQGDHA